MLAVDWGSRRIGIAVSDPARVIAQPLTSVPAEPQESLAERICALAREQGAEEVVVGLPRRLDGTSGPEARAARELADRLRRLSGLSVVLVDERLSSAAAERALVEAGTKRARRRQLSDQVAAALILQQHLDLTRRAGGS